MDTFWWIFLSGVLMSAIALVGSVTLLLKESTLDRIIMPLVSFAAGSLLGGAFLHMLPAALSEKPGDPAVFLWVLVGFATFFALEQFLHWHHCHRASSDCKKPLTYLILLGDGLHNFLGGLGVAGVFLIDVRLGIAAWLAAAAHEVPQELGDFGVLIHGGLNRSKALVLNLLSGLTFLIGSLVAYAASARIEVEFLVPFAAVGLGVLEADGPARRLPDVRDHESAVEVVGFDESHQIARARRRGFLDHPGIALLKICDAPAVLVGTGLSAVAGELLEREGHGGRLAAGHCKELAHGGRSPERIGPLRRARRSQPAFRPRSRVRTENIVTRRAISATLQVGSL